MDIVSCLHNPQNADMKIKVEVVEEGWEEVEEEEGVEHRK